MKENEPSPVLQSDRAITPKLAQTLYERGRERFKKPKPHTAPNGLDLNSYHARGCVAAMDVGAEFRGPNGETSLAEIDTSALEQHYDRALYDMQNEGLVRLAPDFVEGYRGWAAMTIRWAQEDTQLAAPQV